MTTSASITHRLDKIPTDAILRSVTATPDRVGGRDALRVSLMDQVARHGRLGVDYGDQPTFVVIPADFIIGIIEVDVLGRLTPEATHFACAFAGLAYHLPG